MGFLGNVLESAVKRTVRRTVNSVVNDAADKASEAIGNTVKSATKSAIDTGKSRMREKILEGAKAYRDQPLGKVDKDSNVVLFASDKQIAYRINGNSYKVDVVGCVTWSGKDYNFAESDPSFYANAAYYGLQTELDKLAAACVDPYLVSKRLPNILANVNAGKYISEKTLNQYGHEVLLSLMLLELPGVSTTIEDNNEVYNVGNTHSCEYCGTTYIGNTCPHCGVNFGE
ncbi:MAG: hypothetical protein IJZ79_02805 [Bacilli bacterium]|nr:hypothetical protein [Bacilli bacterium]MBQ8218655.1 hypothetical protein [Bacilli bacterium]